MLRWKMCFGRTDDNLQVSLLNPFFCPWTCQAWRQSNPGSIYIWCPSRIIFQVKELPQADTWGHQGFFWAKECQWWADRLWVGLFDVPSGSKQLLSAVSFHLQMSTVLCGPMIFLATFQNWAFSKLFPYSLNSWTFGDWQTWRKRSGREFRVQKVTFILSVF